MKRLIVFMAIIGIFMIGVYIGSLDLSFATDPSSELTEQQVIDIF